MSGDVGDNIPSVYYSDKKRALRDAGARKLIDIYKEKIDSDLTITPKLMEYMAQIICDSKKIPLEDEKTYKSIINAFERNNKLINLTEIPQDILDKIDEKIKDII